jgi:hypothetical protein
MPAASGRGIGTEVLGEAGVAIGCRRQFIGEQCRIDLGGDSDLLMVMVLLNEHQACQQHRQGHQRSQTQPDRWRPTENRSATGLTQEHGSRSAPDCASAFDGTVSRHAQPLGNVVRQLVGRLAQRAGQAKSDTRFKGFVLSRAGCNGRDCISHGAIPLARRALARAWTALEQWVFTLPSEQPITIAVSATSSSSQ